MSKSMSFEELSDTVNKLSLTEFMKLIDNYSENNNSNLNKSKLEIVQKDIQQKLVLNGINQSCPYCHSKMIVKNGTHGVVQRFKCQKCQKGFTLFTGTLLEKTRYPWEVWVKVLEMTLNNLSLETMVEILSNDYGLLGIDRKSISTWRHKLTHAMAMVPMPILSGVIQIDETHFREDQKGSRRLVSFVTGEERKPRRGAIPAKLGVMGNEFANVVCMVDAKGYAVAKVVGLGKLEIETFFNNFDKYISNPSYICADGNLVYQEYCKLRNYRLYVRPSNYLNIIKKNTVDKSEHEQQKILNKLYKNHQIDYIFEGPNMTYEGFCNLKQENGLSLSRVNQFHSFLKEHLVTESHGITTKFLPDYVGTYVYIRNWSLKHNHLPVSSKDAEDILIELLKLKDNFKIDKIENTKITSTASSSRYMALLKEKTETARALTGNEMFKFTEEDGVINFNIRNFLNNLPAYKLNKLRAKYRIPKKWVKYAIINKLLEMPNINNDIIELIDEYKANKIEDEDRKAVIAKKYIRSGHVKK